MDDAPDDARSLAAFDALLGPHPVPAWIYLRTTLRIVAVNDAACSAYGYDRATFLTLDLMDLRSPDEGVRLQERLRRQGPDVVHPGPARWRHRRADGSEFAVDVTASPVTWAGALAVLVVARNLSEEERTRAEQRVTEAERRSALHRALLRLYERPWNEGEDPFQIVLEEALEQLGGARGSALARTERGTFAFVAAVGYDLARLSPLELPADQVLFGRDWSDGEPDVVHSVPDVVIDLPASVPAQLTAYTLETGIAATLVVPIVLAGRLEAALCLDRLADGPPFADDALPRARLFARQVELALGRRTAEADVRLHRDALADANRELEGQVEQMATLRRIDAAIADQTEPAAVLDVILEQLLLHARVDAAAVLLKDPDAGTLRYAATLGLPRHLLHDVALRPGEGLAGRALAASAPLAVDGRERLIREHAAGPAAMLGRFEAYTAFPLLAKGRPLGVLEAYYVDGSARTPGHAAFVAAIAGQAAVALDVAQLLDRLRTAAASYRDLANFSGAIEDLHDVDALLETGATTLRHEFGMDSAAFFVGRGDALHLERSWGSIPDGILEIASQPQPIGKGAVGIAAATREPVYLPDYGAWPNATPGLADLGLATLLCLPVTNDARVDVLVLASYERRHELRSDQRTVARAFVRRLEHALERADYLQEIEATREEAFRALGLALEYRDYETKGHTDRVVALTQRFAAALELPPERAHALQWGAYLHDIGKIAIPDQVLLKPSRLDAAEYAIVRTHAAIGDDLCRDLRFLPVDTRHLVRSHHERWDGAGYPDGLVGEAIPLAARLFSLIDVYDALTSERPYKAAWTHEAAVAELVRGAGSQFDPELTARFVALLEEGTAPPSDPSQPDPNTSA